MQVMYLGRAPRTKESLPDFLKWCRVTRHPLVFRRLTGSQRTPGNGGVTHLNVILYIVAIELDFATHIVTFRQNIATKTILVTLLVAI